MSDNKMLARDYGIEVSSDGTTYLNLPAVSSFSMEPSTSTTDFTTFDDNGRTTNVPTSIEYSFSVEGFRVIESGALHPAQAMVEQYSNRLGYTGRLSWRITHTAASGELTFDGWANAVSRGGGNNDGDPFNFDVNVEGSSIAGTGIFDGVNG